MQRFRVFVKMSDLCALERCCVHLSVTLLSCNFCGKKCIHAQEDLRRHLYIAHGVAQCCKSGCHRLLVRVCVYVCVCICRCYFLSTNTCCCTQCTPHALLPEYFSHLTFTCKSQPNDILAFPCVPLVSEVCASPQTSHTLH